VREPIDEVEVASAEKRGAVDRWDAVDWRAIVEVAGAAVFVYQDETLRYLNQAACALTGYEPEELIGRPFWTVLAPEDQPRVRERGMAQQAGRELSKRYEVRVVRKDGQVRFVDFVGSRISWQGRPAALGVARDVTPRVTAERKLVASLREVQARTRKLDQLQRLESLGVLAGGVAHEFNNILQAIVGNAALVQKTFPPDAMEHDCCAEVLAASRRAAELCREMLAYSGRGRFVVERVDLSDALRELARLLESAVEAPARLEVAFASGLPLIEVDRTQLQQVALNLATNARESYRGAAGAVSIRTFEVGPPHEGCGAVCFGQLRADRRYAALEVSDRGEGLSAAALERVFDPFFSTKRNGRGLGLSAVVGIVRAHDGVLCLDSEPGLGTTIRVLWLAAQDAAVEDVVRRPGEAARPFHGTVLLAEDEPSVRRAARRILEAFGFEVLVAEDGQRAIELLTEEPERVSVALLDVVMPRVGGEEAFWAMRAVRPDLPVILMSGYTVSRVPETIRGLASFLQKPFTPESLAAKLAEALGHAVPLRPLHGPGRLL